MDEISIQFGKGLAQNFTAKDGREMVRVKIPNTDPEDKRSWASFVLPAKAVHENKFGKGLWAKIPAEGTTNLVRPVPAGEKDGRTVWENQRETVTNAELKTRVEAYKTASRDSVLDKLHGSGEKAPVNPVKPAKPKTRDAGMEI